MTNEVEILDISPRGIEVIETQYSIDGTPTCIHTHCSFNNYKYLTINLTTFGLFDKTHVVQTEVTFDMKGAKQLRDMLVTSIDGLEGKGFKVMSPIVNDNLVTAADNLEHRCPKCKKWFKDFILFICAYVYYTIHMCN